MTPDFALSLSFDGIRLLHRVDQGWHIVGDVALDTPDLEAALKRLRADAEQLGRGPLRTKLLIPDDQIKYVTIDTAQTSLENVQAALDGATPYSIDDLAIDFDRNGGRTFIAAVARETLEEAEAFAIEHDFAPVCFAAIAAPFTFQSEVFFGPTKAASSLLAKGETVRRDDTAVTVTGTVERPEAAPDSEPAPVVMADETATGPVELDDFGTTAPDAPEDTPGAADVVFASRSRATTAPSQEAEAETPDEGRAATPTGGDKPPPPDDPKDDPATPAAPAPLFTRRKDPPALAVPVGVTDGPRLGHAEQDTGTPVRPVTATAPTPVTAPPLTGLPKDAATDPAAFTSVSVATSDPMPDSDPIEVDEALPAPVPPPNKPAPVSDIAASKSDDKAGKAVSADRPVSNGKPRFLALKLTAALLLFLFLVALWANTWTEDGIAGWFGSNDEMTVATADTPDTIEEDPMEADILPLPETAAETVLAPEPTEVASPAPSALTPEIDEIATETVAEPAPLPIVRAPAGRILTPAEADRIYAATGVWQRAPRFALEPRTRTLDGFTPYAALPGATRLDGIALPDQDVMFPDFPPSTPLNPPPPGTTFQRDLRGFILATPDGIMTPDGAFVLAGPPPREPPLRPGTPVPAAPVVASETTATDAERTDAPDIILVAGPPPRVPPLRPDNLVPAAPEVPAVETPEVAPETPDPADEAAVAGLVGASDLQTTTPAARPDGLSPTLSEADEGDVTIAAVDRAVPLTSGGVSLASFRPAARPGGLAPVPPAPAFADPALAGLRPNVRPAGLAANRDVTPEGPDLSSVVAAIAEAAPPSSFVNVTPRAIQISARPDPRPRNFARVVTDARNRAARQTSAPAATTAAPAPAAVVSAAPARPTGPVPGSVAQAATVSNAIRLRDINLIGVYGRPGDRRALVRTGNGRFVKVEIGSSLDGGRVTAIGDSALNYVKRGRTYALQLPAS